MSNLYSAQYLRTLSKTRSSLSKAFSINESKERETFDIFLSHSFLDKEIIEGLYLELTDLGFSVYVDWVVDPTLDRKNVTKGTATLIRRRLRASQSLLLAISVNASTSNWMPWELGVMDGDKGRCAILPITETTSQTSFQGYEYLSLYPFVKKHPNHFQLEKLWVIESSDTYVIFDDWLEKNLNPFKRSIKLF